MQGTANFHSAPLLEINLSFSNSVIKTTPSLDVNAIYNLNQPSMLYDDQGNFIDDLPSTEIRYIISYDEMPQNLINAYNNFDIPPKPNVKG